MPRMFLDEFQYYIDHQDELVRSYEGKIIVIKDAQVIGAYGSVMEAITKTYKTHEIGTYWVQSCERRSNGDTHKFHTRVFLGKIA
jgi:hypothetical protein